MKTEEQILREEGRCTQCARRMPGMEWSTCDLLCETCSGEYEEEANWRDGPPKRVPDGMKGWTLLVFLFGVCFPSYLLLSLPSLLLEMSAEYYLKHTKLYRGD